MILGFCFLPFSFHQLQQEQTLAVIGGGQGKELRRAGIRREGTERAQMKRAGIGRAGIREKELRRARIEESRN